jgi:hypothetical protein
MQFAFFKFLDMDGSMKTLVSRIVPKDLSAWLSGIKARRAMVLEDQRLGLLDGVEVDEEMIRDCALLASRNELLKRMPNDAVCAEVGVAGGDFADRIMTITKPSKLVLIDCWDEGSSVQRKWEAQVRSRFSGMMQEGRVEVRKGFSNDVLSSFPDHFLDWIYVDADHSFEGALRDLALASAKVKPDGFICGHDYNRFGLNGRYGVVEAVNSFCKKYGYRMAYLTLERNKNHSYALVRRS